MPKKQGLEAIRQATLHVHHAFCTFPCLRFTTLTSNLLTSRFMENVNTTERFSAFLFQKLDRAPYNSIPEKFANIWQIKRGRIR